MIASHTVMIIDIIQDMLVASSFGCLLLVFVIAMFLSNLFKKVKGEDDKDQRPDDHQTDRKIDSEDVINPSHKDETDGSKEKSGFFKKKRVCKDCGTELIYRGSYDSWYCPECRTYK